MTLPIANILAAARTPRPSTPCPKCGETSAATPCSCAGREAVKVLCAGLTDEQLRAEIERIADLDPHIHSNDYRAKHQARDALETVRDERSLAAAIATLPEDRR